jgi:hypothetical protein
MRYPILAAAATTHACHKHPPLHFFEVLPGSTSYGPSPWPIWRRLCTITPALWAPNRAVAHAVLTAQTALERGFRQGVSTDSTRARVCPHSCARSNASQLCRRWLSRHSARHCCAARLRYSKRRLKAMRHIGLKLTSWRQAPSTEPCCTTLMPARAFMSPPLLPSASMMRCFMAPATTHAAVSCALLTRAPPTLALQCAREGAGCRSIRRNAHDTRHA